MVEVVCDDFARVLFGEESKERSEAVDFVVRAEGFLRFGSSNSRSHRVVPSAPPLWCFVIFGIFAEEEERVGVGEEGCAAEMPSFARVETRPLVRFGAL